MIDKRLWNLFRSISVDTRVKKTEIESLEHRIVKLESDILKLQKDMAIICGCACSCRHTN